jgi:hypothetical protein
MFSINVGVNKGSSVSSFSLDGFHLINNLIIIYIIT